jgi:iron complex transport system permease protein
VLAGALVGAALPRRASCSRRCSATRSPRPFTLGVSAGASLGAMLVIILGGTLGRRPVVAGPAASLAGAGIAAAIVYALANGPRRVMSTTVLLLAGVTAQRVLLGADPCSCSTWPTSPKVYRARAG